MRYRPSSSPCTKASSSSSLLRVPPDLKTTSSSTLDRVSGFPAVSPHTPDFLESTTTDPIAVSTTCRLLILDEGSRMHGILPALRPSSDSGWKGPQGLRKRCWPLVCIEIVSEPVLWTVTCKKGPEMLSLLFHHSLDGQGDASGFPLGVAMSSFPPR